MKVNFKKTDIPNKAHSFKQYQIVKNMESNKNEETNFKILHQQMLSGKMYNDLAPVLIKKRNRAVLLTNQYNNSYGKPALIREEILRKILGSMGNNVNFEPNFRCEFGINIIIGDNFFANFDCVMLDCNQITIGNNVLLGPRVGIYTGNHATHPDDRIAGGCYAQPVTIKDNVWIGAGVHILGGVTIGKNSIIGAGSVVTKDIPDNVIAAGIPCKIIRNITEQDKDPYFLSSL